MDWTTEHSGFDSLQEQETFLYSALQLTQPPIQSEGKAAGSWISLLRVRNMSRYLSQLALAWYCTFRVPWRRSPQGNQQVHTSSRVAESERSAQLHKKCPPLCGSRSFIAFWRSVAFICRYSAAERPSCPDHAGLNGVERVWKELAVAYFG